MATEEIKAPKKHRKAKVITTLVVLVLLIGAGLWVFGNKSKGYQIGTHIRCGEDGNVPGCKTHECEFLVGGGTGAASTPGATNVWVFTVPDSEWEVVSKTLDLAAGHLVKAYYEQPRFTNPCTTKSGFYVDKVEILGVVPLPPAGPVGTGPHNTGI